MNWSAVGNWLKDHAGTGASLIGSLLVGNVPGAVAAGVALVSSATGTDDPGQALAALQTDPSTVLALRKLAAENEAGIRSHLESMTRLRLENEQAEHHETQETIRSGDAAADERVRWVRPSMATQSWTATIAYCIGCFGVVAITGNAVFDMALAGILVSPAWAYMGLRTGDKLAAAWKDKRR
jgi:hypothetical protein